MRSFYIFGPDPSRKDLQTLAQHELAGFNYFLLQQGKRIDELPQGLRLLVTSKKRTHLLGNPFGWKIMSDNAIKIIKEYVSESDMQLLEVAIFDSQTKQPVTGYSVVNCLRVITALAYSPGDGPIYSNRVVINDRKVPPDTHMFHLGEEPRHWLISDCLWQRLAKLDGFDAIEIQIEP